MFRVQRLLSLAALATVSLYVAPVPAQTIIDEWASIKAPPAPELKPVTVDPKTTALLVMDLIELACNEKNRPRCVASTEPVNKFETLAGSYLL